jgi:hypothetical protein
MVVSARLRRPGGSASVPSSVTNSPTVDRKRPNGIVILGFSTRYTERERLRYPATLREEARYPLHPRTRRDGPTHCPQPDRPVPARSGLQLHLRLRLDQVHPSLPAQTSDAQEMRRMVAKATSVAEAKLLVDMFLAQWGFPVVTAEATAAVENASTLTVEHSTGSMGQGSLRCC